MRLNRVARIMAHLGIVDWRTYRRMRELGAPIYRDPDDPRRVWADSDELDAWDRERCRPDPPSGVSR